MATFKLTIADPKAGKTYKKEVKDNDAKPFIGMNIGENVKGETLGMTGYELTITGGSDYCGFPMRKGIQGIRKKVNLLGGVGFKGKDKGVYHRKTVCGHKINDKITQINLSISKQGAQAPDAVFGAGDAPKEGDAPAEEKAAEAPKEAAEKKE